MLVWKIWNIGILTNYKVKDRFWQYKAKKIIYIILVSQFDQPRAPSFPFDQVLGLPLPHPLLGDGLRGEDLAAQLVLLILIHGLHQLDISCFSPSQIVSFLHFSSVQYIFTLFIYQVKFGLVKVVILQRWKVVLRYFLHHYSLLQ